jgi:hypothetical protein
VADPDLSIFSYGLRLSPLCTAATVWPVAPPPDDTWWWLWSNWWNANWQGKPKYSEKACPSDTLSTTNPTWSDPGSNLARRYGKQGNNRPSYGTAIYLSLFILLPLCSRGHPWHALFHFSFLILRQPVGLLGRGICPSHGRYLHTGQNKHRINADKNPCFEWNSNPRSQHWSGRRHFMS